MVRQLTMRLPLPLDGHDPDLIALLPLPQSVALHVGQHYLVVLGRRGDRRIGTCRDLGHSLRHVLVRLALARGKLRRVVQSPLVAVPSAQLLQSRTISLLVLQLDLLTLIRHH